MTDTIFINARLIDPVAQTDMLGALRMRDGVIAEVYENPRPDVSGTVVNCAGNCLAPGIVDIGVKVSEPGERHKESFRSAGQAAAAGGVTTIVTRPDTMPAIDTPETLEFVAAAPYEMCLSASYQWPP